MSRQVLRTDLTTVKFNFERHRTNSKLFCKLSMYINSGSVRCLFCPFVKVAFVEWLHCSRPQIFFITSQKIHFGRWPQVMLEFVSAVNRVTRLGEFSPIG
jgi:hypothetical protein